MILVKWPNRVHCTKPEHTSIGIVTAYVSSPDGTRAIIAEIGNKKPVEVYLRDLEWVLNPTEGQKKIKHALKALQKPEKSTEQA